MSLRPVILVVEDDQEMRRLLATVVRGLGGDVVESADGDAATDYLRSAFTNGRVGRPDLVISDVRLPGASGLEVLASLRRLDGVTPFVIITAFGDDDTHHKAYRLGAAAVLDKPFDLDELRQVIRRLVPMQPGCPPQAS